MRDDEELAFFQPNVAIAKFHPKSPLDYEEQLILSVVVVPHERPLELDQLDSLAV
jgi:hypothetical protein